MAARSPKIRALLEMLDNKLGMREVIRRNIQALTKFFLKNCDVRLQSKLLSRRNPKAITQLLLLSFPLGMTPLLHLLIS